MIKDYTDLFITFFKVGSLTFGGGYAMIPILERELIDNKNWTTKEELLDYYAIAQSTPGIIAVNTASFIGYNRKGIKGAVAATLGVICPSLIIILLIASFLQNFADIEWVQKIFIGIRIAVCGLLTNTFIGLFKSSVKSIFLGIIFIISFILAFVFKFSPMYIVVFALLTGVFLTYFNIKIN